MNFFKKLFQHSTSARKQVKDVKPGDIIYIELDRIQGGIRRRKCLNNDPEKERILLQIRWANIKEGDLKLEKIILNYSAKELANFHLLNSVQFPEEPKVDTFDIASLQKQLQKAIEKEDYEKAEEIKKEINKIQSHT